MSEIPVTLVKANQAMLVILTSASIILQSSILVAVTLMFIGISLVFGPKANLAIFAAKKITKKDLSTEPKESAVLLRFNQSIAAGLLTVALIVLITVKHWSAWIFVGMVTIAATVALMGFCVGCFLFYQWKKWNHKLSSK
ncbi:protein of unknown function [Evansella caseinilytica]|uniref:DUF4395 domain-containing protein n=1 Tax=Evansella caseinilytica TaxID=1503961 RepID=A0A1H3NSL5_9BACI|nr:DUF4395 domain-containing protein [Evansella caseinilytica]SDY91425.1 protein of unknown function [Evansella caseinilytica]